MSAVPKRKTSDNHPSDGDTDGDAPPPFKAAKLNNDDSILVCEISKTRRVNVKSWQGRIMVDIREFYLKDGKHLPSKKGISLTMDQWKVLRDHAEKIDEAVAENS